MGVFLQSRDSDSNRLGDLFTDGARRRWHTWGYQTLCEQRSTMAKIIREGFKK